MNCIKISGFHYQSLRDHLLPGDNLEAVAIALCGRSVNKGSHTLVVQDLLLVPYDICYERRGDYVHWPTEVINPFLEKAMGNQLAIVKFHCHPGPGIYEFFSEIDDESDQALFKSIHSWLDDGLPHASCVMLSDGRIFGRFFPESMNSQIVDKISVVGSDLTIWRYTEPEKGQLSEKFQTRNLQAFGRKTVEMLNMMKIGVVGCSGTGSPVIEQLKRLGVGTLVLVDPDFVDDVNVNRIIGSSKLDAENKLLKVDVMRRGISEVGMGTQVITFPSHISKRDVIKELADCDCLLSCVDGAEARHVLNLISSFYISPLIDMGVKFDADGNGGIKGIFGSVHYIQPGGSSLWSRGQYDLEQVRAEGIKRINKEEYLRNQYLARVGESQPAVISVNLQVASTAVNDLLARIHPFRNIMNNEVDSIKILFADATSYPEQYPVSCSFFRKYVGIGDIEPLLANPELSNVTEIR